MIAGAVHAATLASAFFILWFLAFFCLLPVGLGAVDPETGAPLDASILKKAGIAFVIAAVLWSTFTVLIVTHVLDL
ncbi:MAG: hypothetical protein KGJ78_17650 [Alphaproteobacteria bacterium]|nr:hypothetical protein [Alphaproteobacteria bacterium]